MLSVSDDECLPGTSTPSGLSKGSFLKSWLPLLSPKKQQLNDSLCDSGFQDTLLTSSDLSEARSECPEVTLPEKEPRQSSNLLTCALPLAATFVVFGALGFGLMMMINKEAVEVDHQLNGKYKSMQFARERIQTGSNEEGDVDDDYVDEVLVGNMQSMDYPDDPQFRPSFPGFVAEENYMDNTDTNDVNPDVKQDQDDLIDYPDDPQFRAAFV
jgi:hypothetical protein